MAHAKVIEGERYTYTVVFEPDEEVGGYTVTCPALPGLVTEGDTLEEARAMAADAIRCYLESMRKDGEPIPRQNQFVNLSRWYSDAEEPPAPGGMELTHLRRRLCEVFLR